MKRFISLSIVTVLTIASFVSAGQICQPSPSLEVELPAVPAQARLKDEWTLMDRYDLLIDEPLMNYSEQQYV